ncbi:MAG: 4-(cytidine 5'-diphospho)-2-C-methyl-D-erythritol kinase [Wujia sp.]
MKCITRKAYAKVNLALDVLRRREDGYHDVCMIMQNLDLYDVLTFELQDSADVEITISCDKDFVPCDERNLIYKAAKLMFDTYHLTGRLHVDLKKQIPVEAGMAGGSTDCAATFHAMNELFDLHLSKETLQKHGVTLGADVPYCILAKTARSEGIGEILTPLPGLPDCYVLVVKPPIRVSTKMVYENLHANSLTKHPDVAGMEQALKKGDICEIASYMENVLETVTVELYPMLEKIKDVMKEHGACNAIMSGSGPTIFGIYTDEAVAKNAKDAVLSAFEGCEAYVVMPVSE